MKALIAPAGWVGEHAFRFLRFLGVLSVVLVRCARQLHRMNREEVLRAFVLFGQGSLGLSVLVAALTGATVVLQTFLYVQRFGARAYLGWAASYAVIWEFGPLLLGLMMAARVGARNAAELAVLNIGGQIEGLRGIALDPFALLIAPRVVGIIASVTLLAAPTFAIAIVFEIVAAYATMALPVRVFTSNLSDMLGPLDVVGGVLKTLTFGVAISLVSTAVGVSARGGARAVGRASASAVAWSCASIFGLDFLLTPLLAAAVS